MDNRYAVIERIDGKKTVTNIILAPEHVAIERNLTPAENLSIGDVEVEGKFIRPEPKELPMNALEILGRMTDKQARKLLQFLKKNDILSED
jgi:hypothetical protein